MSIRALALVVLTFTGCGTGDPARAHEISRVHAHLARVEAVLAGRAVDNLSPAQQHARTRALANLRGYIDADGYPTNDVSAEPTPIFIDRDGVRCAMAYLIEATGDDGRALVARVATADNYAHLADLATDAELSRWLAANGLTLAEAAAIQPSYANTTSTRWVATFSALTSAQVGVRTGDGDTAAEAVLALGVRVGARRIESSDSSCDRCVFRANAIVAEYARVDVFGIGGTNQLAVLLQHELAAQGRDHQFYVLGGPLASLAERDAPGSGVGAEVGVGFSLQRRALPILGEIVASEITHAHGAQIHAGITVGVVW